MKLVIKYVWISAQKTAGNCRWRLQKPVTTHYLQSLNALMSCDSQMTLSIGTPSPSFKQHWTTKSWMAIWSLCMKAGIKYVVFQGKVYSIFYSSLILTTTLHQIHILGSSKQLRWGGGLSRYRLYIDYSSIHADSLYLSIFTVLAWWIDRLVLTTARVRIHGEFRPALLWSCDLWRHLWPKCPTAKTTWIYRHRRKAACRLLN